MEPVGFKRLGDLNERVAIVRERAVRSWAWKYYRVAHRTASSPVVLSEIVRVAVAPT